MGVEFTGRRAGRTTAIAEWAKKNNGIILCGTMQQALSIQTRFNVRAMTVADLFIGRLSRVDDRPWAPDTTAIDVLVNTVRRADARENEHWRARVRAEEISIKLLRGTDTERSVNGETPTFLLEGYLARNYPDIGVGAIDSIIRIITAARATNHAMTMTQKFIQRELVKRPPEILKAPRDWKDSPGHEEI